MAVSEAPELKRILYTQKNARELLCLGWPILLLPIFRSVARACERRSSCRTFSCRSSLTRSLMSPLLHSACALPQLASFLASSPPLFHSYLAESFIVLWKRITTYYNPYFYRVNTQHKKCKCKFSHTCQFKLYI